MRITIGLFVLALAATVNAQQPQTPTEDKGKQAGDAARLPLKLEKDQEYVFHVNFKAPSVSTKPGNEPQSPGERREGTAPGQEREGAVSLDKLQDLDLEYRINVLRGAPEGEYSLSVIIDADMVGKGLPDTKPAGDGPGEGNKPADNRPGGQEPDKDRAAQAVEKEKEGKTILGRDKEERRDVTLKVSPDGRITSVEGLEDWRSKLDSPEHGRHLVAADQIRGHLQVILGAGLHGKDLQKGQVYVISGDMMTPADRPGQPADKPGSQPPDNKPGSQPTDRPGAIDKPGLMTPRETMFANLLQNVKLRFEGKQPQNNMDVVRFTVLDSTSVATPGRDPLDKSSGAGQGERPSSNKADDRPGSLTGEGRPSGEALYRVDDGLLERFTIELTPSGAVGTPGEAPTRVAETSRLTIRRASDLRTEPPDRR